ncbi:MULTISPECIES: PD-(D/E)XK motif protein [Sphingobacterium]|uniref:PD-(D/E)XK motif protein n=1 Tax=Sphingobacterium TaxID=28453 RepID=UPI0028AE117C|nr:PD-(D/E)XK motif protein [Sphingobacterium multivorum]
MIKNDITEFWKVFEKPEGFRLFTNVKSQNVSLGFDRNGYRSLFVDMPHGVYISEPKYKLEHLSFSIENGARKQLVISLKDDSFLLLFDEFLFAIFSQIHNMVGIQDVGKKIIELYHEWSLFFTKLNKTNINVQKTLGLAGELYYINRYLDISENLVDIVNSWEGPTNRTHDFIFMDYDLEVKAKLETSNTITISSLFQLEFDKILRLGVVSFSIWDRNGGENPTSIGNMVEIILQNLRNSGIDHYLFLNKLLQVGVNFYDREQMDEINEIKFLIHGHQEYDASHNQFPRLVPSNIPSAIKKVKYYLDLNLLDDFKI